MPNNPGRIEGDYSIGEKEQIKYADPGSFGAVRQRQSKTKLYLFIAGVAIITLALSIAFGWII